MSNQDHAQCCDIECACAFEELTQGIQSADPEERRMAVARFSASEDDDPRALTVLVELMNDLSPKIRYNVALKLGHYPSAEAKDALIDHLRYDENPWVRSMCVVALSDFEEVDAELAHALSDTDGRVVTKAAIVLGNRNALSAAPELHDALGSPNWEVRLNACWALLKMAISDEKVVQTIAGLRRVPEAVEAMAEFAWYDNCDLIRQRFGEEIDEIEASGVCDPEAGMEDIIRVLRSRHGADRIPSPTPDPIGDMLEEARSLCRA